MLMLAISVFVLAIAVVAGTFFVAMKTAELTASVNALAAATSLLSSSVDAAVAALGNAGQPSTPDSDIVPLIAQLDQDRATLDSLKAKLDAALANTPTT